MALGDECPAIRELKSAIKTCFPWIECGTIRNPVPADRHTSGIAMDVMLSVHNPAQKALAEGMIAVFKANHVVMQWSDIVYTDINSDGTIEYYHIPGGGRGYGGTPLQRNTYTSDRKHTDHFHIDWVDFNQKNEGAEFLRDPYKWTDAAQRTGFGPVLIAGFKSIPLTLSSATSDRAPAWLLGWWKIVDGGDTYFYNFGQRGGVVWQELRPANGRAPVGHAGNRGTFKLTAADTLQITWNFVAGGQTIETFQTTSLEQKEMRGTSNRWGPLAALRVQ